MLSVAGDSQVDLFLDRDGGGEGSQEQADEQNLDHDQFGFDYKSYLVELIN